MLLENRCVVPSCEVYTNSPDLTAYATDGSPPASVWSTYPGEANPNEAACAAPGITAATTNATRATRHLAVIITPPNATDFEPIVRLGAGACAASLTAVRLTLLASPSDTKALIETAVSRFLDEVPALHGLKLVAGLDLRGRGDIQMYRVELPGPKVTKDIASDAKVRIAVPRSHFNELATKGHVRDWREAFVHGDAKATGIEQVMKLIVNVVERQEERARTRKAKT
jgi:hypothetical protein